MTINRIFRGILSRLGIWWNNYYIMQGAIDIDLINKKIFDLSIKIPHKIVKLTYEDLLKGEKEFYTETKLSKYQEWFNVNNREAYGIINNNELIYSSWICYDKIEITNKTVINKYTNHGLLQDAYCNKKYRGLGVHNYVNMYMLTVMYSKGYKTVIGIVDTKNKPAIKTQENSTLKIKEVITLYSLFGKEILRYK